MLPICSKKIRCRGKGFSLVEVILAMMILSVGMIAVQKVFIQSISAVNVIENWDQAESLVESKIWEIKRAMKEVKDFSLPKQSEGLLESGRQIYQYDLKVKPVPDFEDFLMEATLSVFWQRSGMRRSLTRNFYLMVPYAQWKETSGI